MKRGRFRLSGLFFFFFQFGDSGKVSEYTFTFDISQRYLIAKWKHQAGNSWSFLFVFLSRIARNSTIVSTLKRKRKLGWGMWRKAVRKKVKFFIQHGETEGWAHLGDKEGQLLVLLSLKADGSPELSVCGRSDLDATSPGFQVTPCHPCPSPPPLLRGVATLSCTCSVSS